ncbi:hypothetical protein E2562_009627 [Oryza meyeriana var. granulata]|uniref:Uncharacterized protein n=1 Tax=Oryza meyeriana var. granulata TaxID=110450 RepID=A0A6G1BI84_9ORYZ|nr:hypothetical protein E2562_009627 [Oryza meyeriana var. granulata]
MARDGSRRKTVVEDTDSSAPTGGKTGCVRWDQLAFIYRRDNNWHSSAAPPPPCTTNGRRHHSSHDHMLPSPNCNAKGRVLEVARSPAQLLPKLCKISIFEEHMDYS